MVVKKFNCLMITVVLVLLNLQLVPFLTYIHKWQVPHFEIKNKSNRSSLTRRIS
jgi:uncharacterized membrane protein YkvI